MRRGPTLYLLETRAKYDYQCAACQRAIMRGTQHFRHDPFPAARMHRGQRVSHWCRDCILAATAESKDRITGRLLVPAVRVMGEATSHALEPLQIHVIGVGSLVERLVADPAAIHQLTADQFEALICDRLTAMGFEAQRVGAVNHKDGGIDILFWSQRTAAFPFLAAAQIKHHRDPLHKEGPAAVRELSGAISGHAINAGLLVTNTTFSADAEWFARERAKLIRLRGFDDVRRWMLGSFSDDLEWREIPQVIELCPGVTIKVR